MCRKEIESLIHKRELKTDIMKITRGDEDGKKNIYDNSKD